MLNLTVTLTGTSPLVLHNNRLANPLDVIKKEIAKYTGKRKKTDADHEKIAELEFIGGLYINEDGPFLPALNLRKMLIEGGRKDKRGKDFESGIRIVADAQIDYDGPRGAKELWEDGRFSWTCAVGNQKSTVFRTRPRFSEWSCTFRVDVDEDFLSYDDIERALIRAEKGVGIGDGRSIGCGRFTSEITSGGKPASRREEVAV